MTLLVGSIFHMTRKIVSEMTYNVSMGTLNPTIPYHTIADSESESIARSDVVSSVWSGASWRSIFDHGDTDAKRHHEV